MQRGLRAFSCARQNADLVTRIGGVMLVIVGVLQVSGAWTAALYIAAEMSHIFGSLGTKITIVTRGEHLLSRHDADVRARFTELYQGRFDVRLGATAEHVSATSSGVRLELATPAGVQAAEGEVPPVAAGRVPNSDRLDVAAAGIEVDAHGHADWVSAC